MAADASGTINLTSGNGLYTSLAGGAVPQTQIYNTASATSSNGGSWLDTITGLAKTGAQIYSEVASAKTPATAQPTTVVLKDPNTGKIISPPSQVPANNNSLLLWLAGFVVVVLVAVLALPRLFGKRGN